MRGEYFQLLLSIKALCSYSIIMYKKAVRAGRHLELAELCYCVRHEKTININNNCNKDAWQLIDRLFKLVLQLDNFCITNCDAITLFLSPQLLKFYHLFVLANFD